MKILIITQVIDTNHPILGFFHSWVEEFAQQFEEVIVVCLEEGEHALPENVHVMSLGKEKGVSKLGRLINFYKYCTPLIFSRKVDRIFVHMSEVYVALLLPLWGLIKIRGIQLDWWKTHGHLSKLSKFVYRFVDHILTASDRSFPLVTSKRQVLGHGIDVDVFKLGQTKRENTIISVGRVTPSKRYEDLIQAVEPLSDFCIEIIGLTDETKKSTYFQTLEDLIQVHYEEKRVSFIEGKPYEQMPQIYQSAGILVNTSDTDSMDKVVLEAMACGAIPITSNEAYKDMLEPFGLWVEKRNNKALQKVITHVGNMEQQEKDELREKLRDIVVRDHSLTALITKIKDSKR